LITNTYDTVGGSTGNAPAAAAADPILIPENLILRVGIYAHLTPTKKKKKNEDETDSNISHRGNAEFVVIKQDGAVPYVFILVLMKDSYATQELEDIVTNST
jgi:hypothetical protein